MTAHGIIDAESTAFPVLLDVPTSQSCETSSSAQPSVAQSGHDPINIDPEDQQGGRLRASSAASSSNHSRHYRKLSPGLAARMKLLDITNRKSRVLSNPALGTDKIGRIPESQIRGLETLQQNQSCEIQRRGRAWSHNDRPPTAEGLRPPQAVIGDSNPGTLELDDGFSDRSSVVSTEVNMLEHSGDEQDALKMETQKYRLPDMSKVLQPSAEETSTVDDAQSTVNVVPPRPPPKDRPVTASTNGGTASSDLEFSNRASSSDSSQSYFHSRSLSRANSIYTLSRVSFSNQLSQLTALQLPQASALSESVLGIPTAPAASKALAGAAEQIRIWIAKASEVLSGLDAEDDVEWAAAGGREGLSEVDNAVGRFERLIEVYISAIEQLQLRKDISSVHKSELKSLVEQMEKTLDEWQRVRRMLKGVKEQVEVAMEFEELWGVVLGDIGLEVESLSRLVFEMEEKRHKTLSVDGSTDGVFGLDLVELQTIVEENPTNGGRATAHHRFSLPSAFSPSSPMQSPRPTIAQDDSNLLALFARMQPLRASLDFLPMRLATFHTRAELKFPTACEELESRRKVLEKKWQKLEGDAEALRCELGEDRWVLVFRNAGRQAQKMCESVGRSLSKLFEAVDSGAQHNSPASLAKKIESYEAKKMHYGPAIEQVLAITEKGINERLTVNGEILRLYAEMKKRYEAMQSQMKEMDTALEELNASRSQQLRDSISTIISIDRSTAGSLDTPGSSPASSVIMTGGASSIKSLTADEPRTTAASTDSLPRPSGRRNASMPASSHLPRKTPTSRSSASNFVAASRGATPSPGSRPMSSTPTPNQRPSLAPIDPSKPRWNSSTNVNNTPIGHNPKSLTLTTPSSYRKISAIVRTPRSGASNSSLPLPSPLGREGSVSPALSSPSFPPSRRTSGPYGNPAFRESKSSLPSPLQSLHSFSHSSPISEMRRPGINSQASTPQIPKTRRRSTLIQHEDLSGEEEDSPSVKAKAVRPGTVLSSARRNSMLPVPKARLVSGGGNGRETPTQAHSAEIDEDEMMNMQ
ncbi:MAG: hypothetical protein M1812_002749 [Candelaria pacifica]|nr:MAG: hypothetical protein M1812_002749 [Candelaria pacifica]